eukprot:1150028-Pelagomonas_calceolata.AAC.4
MMLAASTSMRSSWCNPQVPGVQLPGSLLLPTDGTGIMRFSHAMLCCLLHRYRDPSLPIHRTEITRFPHAVLEVKLSLPEGQSAPSWVQACNCEFSAAFESKEHQVSTLSCTP